MNPALLESIREAVFENSGVVAPFYRDGMIYDLDEEHEWLLVGIMMGDRVVPYWLRDLIALTLTREEAVQIGFGATKPKQDLVLLYQLL